MSWKLYLFDDTEAREWEPFSATRPVGELLFGCYTLRARAEAVTGLACAGHLVGEGLAGFAEEGAPAALTAAELPMGEARVVLSSRLILQGHALPTSLSTLLVEGRTVGWVLPPGASSPTEDHLRRPDEAPAVGRRAELSGTLLARPWNLLEANPSRTAEDVFTLDRQEPPDLPAGTYVLGQGILSAGADVRIEPGVVLDTGPGPIRLDDGVRIRATTRLEGPSYVGAGSVLLGGSISTVSIGPRCRIRGEVEASVILGFSNKAHDGFLGHSYLGHWVNLGAFTTNSDLKNSYGPVRVATSRGEEDSGLVKVGCFLGDHVKTGIGTYLDTGTVVGAGSSIHGGQMPPKFVPPFSWGAGASLTAYQLDRFLEVAQRVMARRDVVLAEGQRALLARLWEETRRLRP